MRIWRYLGRLLLDLKCKLPQNGDWLFVTLSGPSDKDVDNADKYSQPSAILVKFAETSTLEAVKVIYDRVKSFERTVGEIANRIYDKSKVVFGAASLAMTILLALGSTLLPPLLAGVVWLRILAIGLACLLILHLGRSLIVASAVMTREVIIRESPGELLDLSSMKEDEVVREMTAKTLAYSIQTHAHTLEKLNQVIIAQWCLRYALIYFFVLTTLSIGVRFGGNGVEGPSVGTLAEEMKTLKRNVETLGSSQGTLATSVKRVENEQRLARRDLRESIDLRKAELGVLRALEVQLRGGQVVHSPAAGGKLPD